MTMAKQLENCNDFDLLWENVENVDRTDDGDVYTYPDGSQLLVSKSSRHTL